MNIFEKMSAITMEIAAVAKNLSVGFGKSSYRAVGESDILAAVKPIEAKYKIYSYPVSRKIINAGELESQSKDYKTGEVVTKKQMYIRIETVYRFVNIENPDETIDVIAYGDGVDPQDKAPGKAMTYSDKYALMKAYKIQTGDDPDQYASETVTAVRQATPHNAQRAHTGAESRQTINPSAAASKRQDGAEARPAVAVLTGEQVAMIRDGCEKHSIDESFVSGRYGKKSLKEMTQADYNRAMKEWSLICQEWEDRQTAKPAVEGATA